jgi:MFS family permease
MALRSLTPLRHRGFRLLVGGQMASNVGDAFYAVALPWYVLAHHGGALLLAVVLVAYGVPRTVLVAVGGHASDRWRPWSVMMNADAVRAAALAALAWVALSGRADVVVLVPIAAILGAGEGLFLPGSFAIIPSLLPDEDLQAGNALASSGTQLSMLIGPALGGLLVAFAGPSTAFLVDAGTFVLSTASLARIRSLQSGLPAVAPAPDGAPEAESGRLPTLRQFLRAQRVLQIILLITVAANLGSGGLSEVALPALVHGPFHGSASGYGVLIAAFGAGGLLGTLVAAQTPQVRRPAVIGSLAFLGEAVCMIVIPYGGLIGAGLALAAFGGLNGFGNVMTITAFQRWAPPAMRGRLMGLLLLSSFGIFPVSVLLGGVIVHAFGPAVFFPLAGVILMLAVLGGLTTPEWRAFGSRDQRELEPAH